MPNKIEPIRGTHIVIQITKHRTNYRYLNEIRKKTLHVKKKKQNQTDRQYKIVQVIKEYDSIFKLLSEMKFQP